MPVCEQSEVNGDMLGLTLRDEEMALPAELRSWQGALRSMIVCQMGGSALVCLGSAGQEDAQRENAEVFDIATPRGYDVVGRPSCAETQLGRSGTLAANWCACTVGSPPDRLGAASVVRTQTVKHKHATGHSTTTPPM